MLAPDDRQLLVEALTPPDGYRFDQGIGTTFSLDLVALLRVPLAFTVFEWEQERMRSRSLNGRPSCAPCRAAPVRRPPDDLLPAGQIAVPQHDRRLLSNSRTRSRARSPSDGGVFHPKVWALHYVAPDEPVRTGCSCCRNLTFDRSWDTALVLDGSSRTAGAHRLLPPRGRLLGRSRGLRGDTATERGRPVRLRAISQDLARVRWDLPPDFERIVFHPIGHDGRPQWPFGGDIRRLLVVSPFLAASALDRLAEAGSHHQLVSRLETLGHLSADDACEL